ncbi:MAG: hypothetical protein DRM98_01690 [Thermoplasmata archaeon]|nr:MAG: hypothetical protein DRM98_01690 [Thermoplasmata archaeon]RLF51170.1 MAG: hypothetical protein DRN24_05405 [Thermoplasmata archaeon]
MRRIMLSNNNNDDAVVGMPIYLIVAIVTASMIIGVLTLSVLKLVNETKQEEVKTEIEKIVSEAENMFEYADEGTLVAIHIEFPDSMSFVVFGSMPINGLAEPNNFKLNENTSNNYYFVMNDGTLYSFSSNARFSGKSTDNFAVFKPGNYNLNLELVKTRGKTYVKVYSQ